MHYNLLLTLLGLGGLAQAHIAAWHKGMYCLDGNGTAGVNPKQNNNAVNPLWNLTKTDWWFHHVNGCDAFPPAEGDFLELPAGGSFTVQLADNRASTDLDGASTSEWPDGQQHPDPYDLSPECITSPNLHTQNETMAAGTAFAISYVSNLSDVTMENLVIFTVLAHTPFKLLATYEVPAALPACPEEGCICAWGWIPNGCGEPNMYMEGFRCKVTGATSTTPVAPAQPPVWCEDDPTKCVKGAKQFLVWNQLDGDNIKVSGQDLAGSPKSPGYNPKCGFSPGAQNDIFQAETVQNSPRRMQRKHRRRSW